MSNYTFLDLAYDVLNLSKKPLTYQEAWEFAKEKGLDEKVRRQAKLLGMPLARVSTLMSRTMRRQGSLRSGVGPPGSFFENDRMNCRRTQ